jgi:hypothetical protein
MPFEMSNLIMNRDLHEEFRIRHSGRKEYFHPYRDMPSWMIRYFEDLNRHIEGCNNFNGFIISAREMIGRDEPRYLRCSCGEEFPVQAEMWSFRYGRMHFDDIIMDLNYRNMQYFRNREAVPVESVPVESVPVKKKKRKRVKKVSKKDVSNAIDELEI